MNKVILHRGLRVMRLMIEFQDETPLFRFAGSVTKTQPATRFKKHAVCLCLCFIYLFSLLLLFSI